MLVVDDVHTYYGQIHALRGVKLTVAQGEVVTLIGANGAGKTTTLKTISGLLHARQGSVHVRGRGHHRSLPPMSWSSGASGTRPRVAASSRA